MSVTPTDIVIDGVTIPTLTLAAGSTGGLGVAASIDPVNDYLAIYQNSSTSTLGINRNTVLGLSSAPVGLTDTQTLTNKTLTSPTIAGPVLSGTVGGTYTLGGTPTFPASVATLTGAQVLTNKTLTSPTINSPSITNATLTTDAVTGYTTSNSGVVYGGLTMTTGNATFSGNATVGGTLGVTGVLTPSGGVAIPWQSWVPVWTGVTIGNAVISAYYLQIGKGVWFYINGVIGTTTTLPVGTDTIFTLPVASVSTYIQRLSQLGTASSLDGGIQQAGACEWWSTTQAVLALLNTGGGSTVQFRAWDTTYLSWASGDTFGLNGYYQAA